MNPQIGMMTIVIIISKLNVRLEDVSKPKIVMLQELIDIYNAGKLQKSNCLTNDEVFIRRAKGIIYGYLPEIEGIIYEEIALYKEEYEYRGNKKYY